VKFGQTILRKLRIAATRFLPFMTTCQELEGFIVDYLDGTLPERQRLKFELHLRMCRDCRRYLEQYNRTIALSQAAFCEPHETAAQDVPQELVRAILAARREPD
jgi:anti-sigma factor RsiW